MATDVRVGTKIFFVEDTDAEKAAFDLIEGRRTIQEVREYLLGRKVTTPRRDHPLGYVDFEKIEEGNPTIVGNYYRINTTYGKKLYPPKGRIKFRL